MAFATKEYTKENVGKILMEKNMFVLAIHGDIKLSNTNPNQENEL